MTFSRSRPRRARCLLRASCRRATAALIHPFLSAPGYANGFAHLCVLLTTADTLRHFFFSAAASALFSLPTILRHRDFPPPRRTWRERPPPSGCKRTAAATRLSKIMRSASEARASPRPRTSLLGRPSHLLSAGAPRAGVSEPRSFHTSCPHSARDSNSSSVCATWPSSSCLHWLRKASTSCAASTGGSARFSAARWARASADAFLHLRPQSPIPRNVPKKSPRDRCNTTRCPHSLPRSRLLDPTSHHSFPPAETAT